jgi:hypothetical protein
MDDNGATTDFARAGATSRSCAAGPDSPIPYWVSPAAQSCGAENPPIKPEGGREKTTAGLLVRSLCQLTVFHETSDPYFSMGWWIRIS